MTFFRNTPTPICQGMGSFIPGSLTHFEDIHKTSNYVTLNHTIHEIEKNFWKKFHKGINLTSVITHLSQFYSEFLIINRHSATLYNRLQGTSNALYALFNYSGVLCHLFRRKPLKRDKMASDSGYNSFYTGLML